METGELIPEPSVEEKINTAKEHLHGLVKIKSDYVGPRQFRGQAAYYLKGISHSARTKVKLNNAESEEEMDQIFDDFLEKDAKRNTRKNA
ncbi:hypothetical protein FRFR103141_05355 [Fructilactobacillus fructivorans]|nr:TIM-barrel protein, nifR3 family [Fructilactobacillus fructivorans]